MIRALESGRPRARNNQRKMKSMKYLIALLAIAGIVVSTMALRVHYMDPAQAPPCAVTEKFDCGAVNHSRFAVFPPHTFDEDPKAGWSDHRHRWQW